MEDNSRSKYTENTMRPVESPIEALWISSDEFGTISNLERWFVAHTSQPIGKPLHKHKGYVILNEDSITFYDSNMNLLFSIERNKIKSIEVEYDEMFKRFRDSRGFNPPLKIQLENKSLYLFTKKEIGSRSINYGKFRGNNETIENWFRS